jgi:hypothetical protein
MTERVFAWKIVEHTQIFKYSYICYVILPAAQLWSLFVYRVWSTIRFLPLACLLQHSLFLLARKIIKGKRLVSWQVNHQGVFTCRILRRNILVPTLGRVSYLIMKSFQGKFMLTDLEVSISINVLVFVCEYVIYVVSAKLNNSIRSIFH